MGATVMNTTVDATPMLDSDVDHLLATPLAGTVIVVSLILGSTVLVGVLTGSVLAVAVVVIGAVGVALMLTGLDRVGDRTGSDRPHLG